MRLKANKMILAGLMLAGGLVGSAHAQDYLFRIEPTSARPGETAQIKVFVTSLQPVAALNFTISSGLLDVSDDDELLIDGNVTGDMAPGIDGAAFTYVENSPAVLSGKQYRAVLYGQTVGATFPASTEQHVATLNLPISASAAPGAVINLTLEDNFDTDGITGLLGLSNADGDSLVNSGTPATSRPAKVDGFVRVDPVKTDLEYEAPSISGGWRYGQGLPWLRDIYPAPPTDPTVPVPLASVSSSAEIVTVTTSTDHGFFWGEKVLLNLSPDPNSLSGTIQVRDRTDTTFTFLRPGTPDFGSTTADGSATLQLSFTGGLTADGVDFVLNSKNSYARLDIPNTDPANFFKTGASDMIVLYEWQLSTTGAHPTDLPAMRARSNAADFSWSQVATFQDTQFGSLGPWTVPSAGTSPKTIKAAVYIPDSVTNGTNYTPPGGSEIILDGLTFSLDAVAAGAGTVGTSVVAQNFKARSFSVADLQGEQAVYSHSFADNGTDGFVATNSVLDITNAEGVPQGVYTTTSSTDGGLGVTPNRYDFIPYVDPVTGVGVPGLYNSSFGWWEKRLTQWVLETGKIYRVDFTVASTATDVSNTPNARLRFTGGIFAWVQEVAIETNSPDPANYPSQAGKTYTAYLIAPEEVVGSDVLVSFDMFLGGEGNEGGVILKDLTVRSYDMPEVP